MLVGGLYFLRVKIVTQRVITLTINVPKRNKSEYVTISVTSFHKEVTDRQTIIPIFILPQR